MYEQFKELADVDITAGPMEVGPTTHYVMGGIRVDAETGATTRARPVRGGRGRRAACTARTAWVATRCPTCWCSGRGRAPARRRTPRPRPWTRTWTRSRSRRPRATWRRRSSGPRARTRTRSSATSRRRCSAWSGSSGSRPTSSRRSTGWPTCAARIATLKVGGGRVYNPGWNLVFELAEHARRVRGDHPQRAAADGEPRRPQPARLPGDRRRRVGRRQQRRRQGRPRVRWRSRPLALPAMPDDLRGLLGSDH